MSQTSDDLNVAISALYVHPVKSCAGISVRDALLIETGLEFDRAWMVVDAQGHFISQREQPRMALIVPTLKHTEVVLRAPGMLALHLAIDTVEAPTRVTVWKHEFAAYDMGNLAAQWFTDFLGQPCRLVRFDPEQRRLSSREWTGDLEAENAFSDGFPLLVASDASLADLNERLARRGVEPVGMNRFRPNIVLSGLDAYGEDHLDEIRFDTPEGEVVLKLVKPCVRCTIPSVDPGSGLQGQEPGDTLSTYRADPRMDGGITFAMNAVIVKGIECGLRVGQTGTAGYLFD